MKIIMDYVRNNKKSTLHSLRPDHMGIYLSTTTYINRCSTVTAPIFTYGKKALEQTKSIQPHARTSSKTL